jgi:ketosteroid isomerase-like protein
VTSSNVEASRRWFETFNEGTIEELLELCDPEIEMWNPPDFPVRDHYRGHAGIRQWREDSFDIIDELRIDVDDVIDGRDGETVVMMLRLRGVASHTRIPIDVTWAAHGKVRDGKLYRAQGYFSRREALRAAGLLED